MVHVTLPSFVRSLCLLLLMHVSCFADIVGSIFVTGHDPDSHGQDGIGRSHGAASLAGRVTTVSAVPEPAAESLVPAMMLVGLLLWQRHRAA